MPDLTQISFERPWALLLLAVPVLLVMWEATRTGVQVSLPFDHRAMHTARPRRRRMLGALIIAANLLPALLLTAAVVLVAGPRRDVEGGRERQMANIQICLDISGSMSAGFGSGTRYDAAMEAVADFTSYRKGDAFGLTVFGNEVLHWVPLTKDTDAVRRATPFVRPGQMPRQFGGTFIGHALSQCRLQLIQRPEGDRLVILISDGVSADLRDPRPAELAQELRSDNIVVYHIHVGAGQIPAAMYEIANTTGGEVFVAGDPSGLESVFRRIDQMQATKLKPPGKAYEDWFGPAAWLALAAAALHALALLGLRFTPW